jgi:hypothetical protein
MGRRVTFLLLGCVLAAALPAGAQSLTISGKSSDTGAASKDFATEVMGDPWDFEDLTDYNYNFSTINGTPNPVFQAMPTNDGGVLHGVLKSGQPKVAIHFEGVPGAFNLASKTGFRYPIDANRFKRLSFRLRRSAGAPDPHEFIGAQWSPMLGASGGGQKLLYIADVISGQRINRGVVASQTDNGYHIYMMDLDANTAPYDGSWGGVMGGLYLNPVRNDGLGGSSIDLDWVRLTERGTTTKTLAWSGFSGRVTLTATNAQTGDAIQIFADNGAVDFANPGSYTWDYGFLPAGTWTIKAQSGAQSRTVTLNIDAMPVINVTDPDETGGQDFATVALADPWDLTNPQDLRYGGLNEIVNASFTEFGLEGTTAPAGNPNPFVQFSGRDPNFRIDANTYHHLTFTLAYDHPELGSDILSNTWGGISRVIWNGGTGGVFRSTQDLVLYNGIPNTYTLDLAQLNDTNTQIEDQGGQPGPAWAGTMGNLWIRVNEAAVSRWFRLSNVKLTADDAPNGNGFFVVKWRTFDSNGSREIPNASGGDATVDLYYDTDTDSSAGLTPIVSGVRGSDGAYAWDVSGLSPGKYYIFARITDGSGNTQARYSTAPVNVPAFPAGMHTDSNSNGLPDQWEQRFGVTDPNGDDDGDGVTNAQEYAQATNPLVPNTMALSEGATNSFFTTRIALANPDSAPAEATLTFLRGPGSTPITRQYSLAPWGRATVKVNEIAGLAGPADVSTIVQSTTGGVIAERTMFWDSTFYGGSTGKAIDKARTQWFLAEGVANTVFDTFILMANATGSPANVTLRFLRDGAGPIDKQFQVPPTSRVTIYTNDLPELNGFSFSTQASSDQPITMERSTYFHWPGGRPFEGGTEDAAIPGLSTQWYLAEGQASPTFAEFILLGNPNPSDAHVQLRYLMPGGRTATQNITVGASRRLTIALNDSSPTPADSPWNLGVRNTDVSVAITSDIGIAVERAMYWNLNGGLWTDGHSSSGVTSQGTIWALAEGEAGGPLGFESFILFANPNANAAHVRLTFLRAAGAPPVSEEFDVPANSRVTRYIGEFIARGLIAPGEQVGARVDSLNGVPLVIERAMYWNGGGETWGGGTGETGFKLK